MCLTLKDVVTFHGVTGTVTVHRDGSWDLVETIHEPATGTGAEEGEAERYETYRFAVSDTGETVTDGPHFLGRNYL
jgi:hypothetical protein